MTKFPFLFFSLFFSISSMASPKVPPYLAIADSTLNLIYQHFRAEEGSCLLNETFPFDPKNVATYVINQDTVSKKRVAYLWPTSGVLSGVVALYEATHDLKYKTIFDSQILPALSAYYDTLRLPACYQSYLSVAGHQDRYYDDNVWLAIDFADLALATKEKQYLKKSEEIWKFVISGWDEKLGGGIYWCEQKKESKNTCSNAPSAVAAAKLYLASKDKSYLQWAKKIYAWTKQNLQDKTDFLYYDNINLNGKISKEKYAYNSGQMLQAAVLLYQLTKDKSYLADAHQLAAACYAYYFDEAKVVNGKNIKLMKRGDTWFTAVMLRGFIELYGVDKDRKYIDSFQQNLDYVAQFARDEHRFFENDWSGKEKKASKWLLPQGAMVEMYARLAAIR